jgi:hypothetical protein
MTADQQIENVKKLIEEWGKARFVVERGRMPKEERERAEIISNTLSICIRQLKEALNNPSQNVIP